MKFHMTVVVDDGDMAEIKWEMPTDPSHTVESHSLVDVPRALTLLAASGQTAYADWLRRASQAGPVAVHLSSYS